MTDYRPSDEDVEHGAREAFFTDMIGGHHNGLFTWDSIPDEGRENYRVMIRHVLAAVLPAHDAALINSLADRFDIGDGGDVFYRETVVRVLRREAHERGNR